MSSTHITIQTPLDINKSFVDALINFRDEFTGDPAVYLENGNVYLNDYTYGDQWEMAKTANLISTRLYKKYDDVPPGAPRQAIGKEFDLMIKRNLKEIKFRLSGSLNV
jgi:hypothetical protein